MEIWLKVRKQFFHPFEFLFTKQLIHSYPSSNTISTHCILKGQIQIQFNRTYELGCIPVQINISRSHTPTSNQYRVDIPINKYHLNTNTHHMYTNRQAQDMDRRRSSRQYRFDRNLDGSGGKPADWFNIFQQDWFQYMALTIGVLFTALCTITDPHTPTLVKLLPYTGMFLILLKLYRRQNRRLNELPIQNQSYYRSSTPDHVRAARNTNYPQPYSYYPAEQQNYDKNVYTTMAESFKQRQGLGVQRGSSGLISNAPYPVNEGLRASQSLYNNQNSKVFNTWASQGQLASSSNLSSRQGWDYNTKDKYSQPVRSREQLITEPLSLDIFRDSYKISSEELARELIAYVYDYFSYHMAAYQQEARAYRGHIDDFLRDSFGIRLNTTEHQNLNGVELEELKDIIAEYTIHGSTNTLKLHSKKKLTSSELKRTFLKLAALVNQYQTNCWSSDAPFSKIRLYLRHILEKERVPFLSVKICETREAARQFQEIENIHHPNNIVRVIQYNSYLNNFNLQNHSQVMSRLNVEEVILFLALDVQKQGKTLGRFGSEINRIIEN